MHPMCRSVTAAHSPKARDFDQKSGHSPSHEEQAEHEAEVQGCLYSYGRHCKRRDYP